MTDNEFCNELHKRAEEYFLKCQKEFAIKEIEKIKAEIKEYGSIWVQYSIKGHTDKDIDNIVDDVLKQAKQNFIQRLDNYISELKGDNNG